MKVELYGKYFKDSRNNLNLKNGSILKEIA